MAQKDIKYGVYKDGSLHDFFKNSYISPYKEMFFNMRTYEGAFVSSTRVGVDKVRQGNFAYLTDEPYLNYYNQKKPCNTRLVKGLLETKGYGIGIQRNSDLTNSLSVAILKVGIYTVSSEFYKTITLLWMCHNVI